ncbi:hypothetical protein D9M69_632110 [compost metagenome]
MQLQSLKDSRSMILWAPPHGGGRHYADKRRRDAHRRRGIARSQASGRGHRDRSVGGRGEPAPWFRPSRGLSQDPGVRCSRWGEACLQAPEPAGDNNTTVRRRERAISMKLLMAMPCWAFGNDRATS